MPSPSKIVFNVPSLMPEDAARRRSGAEPVRPGPASPPPRESAELVEQADVRKLATLLEVSQALAGTLNLETSLYGVLEVLERRCGARRGAITLIEEASGLLVVEAALGYPRTAGRVRVIRSVSVTSKSFEYVPRRRVTSPRMSLRSPFPVATRSASTWSRRSCG